MTIYVEPGRDDCFFQRVKQGEVIDIDYQVINGGLGDLDITFRIIDPNGKNITLYSNIVHLLANCAFRICANFSTPNGLLLHAKLTVAEYSSDLGN